MERANAAARQGNWSGSGTTPQFSAAQAFPSRPVPIKKQGTEESRSLLAEAVSTDGLLESRGPVVRVNLRRKRGEARRQTDRPVVVTYEKLAAHFDKPLPEVAKAMGLCGTSFKSVCRRLGISAWPYQQSKRGLDHNAKREREKQRSAGQTLMELASALSGGGGSLRSFMTQSKVVAQRKSHCQDRFSGALPQ